MDVVINVIANAIFSTALGVSCYVLGNRRAERLIAYRERQAARLFLGDEPQDDAPNTVYRKCLCGHSTTSHRVDTKGNRRGCTVFVRTGLHCACEGYIPDPDTKIKTKG